MEVASAAALEIPAEATPAAAPTITQIIAALEAPVEAAPATAPPPAQAVTQSNETARKKLRKFLKKQKKTTLQF